MRADRHEALLDFLLEAVADEGTTPFPANVLAGMRRVVRCEAVSYREWSPQQLLESSLAAMTRRRSCRSGAHIHRSDRMIHSPVGHLMGARCPTANGSGELWRSPISSAIGIRRRGLYAQVCKPLGVRAVMKVFLPTGRAAGASFVFDTTRSRPSETDRLILERLIRTWGRCGATHSREGPIRRLQIPPRRPG